MLYPEVKILLSHAVDFLFLSHAICRNASSGHERPTFGRRMLSFFTLSSLLLTHEVVHRSRKWYSCQNGPTTKSFEERMKKKKSLCTMSERFEQNLQIKNWTSQAMPKAMHSVEKTAFKTKIERALSNLSRCYTKINGLCKRLTNTKTFQSKEKSF